MTQAWYPFYWADYSSKTMHLTQGQHGAYMLFLRWVYTTEKPIPDKQRYSIARAMTEQERADTDQVLAEFFTLQGDGWVNLKALDVITKTTERHEKRVSAGKLGGLSKSSNAKAKLEQSQSNALLTTTITIPLKDKDINTAEPSHEPEPPGDRFKNGSSEGKGAVARQAKRLYEEFPLVNSADEFANQLPVRWQAVLNRFIEPEYHSVFALDFWDRFVGPYPGAEVSEKFPEKENWFMAWEHAAENANRKAKGLPAKRVFGSKAMQKHFKGATA